MQSFNLYVGRPDSPRYLPSTPPWLHPHWIYRVSPAHQQEQEEALLMTLSAALTLGWGKEESAVASPPHFHLCSVDPGGQLRLAGC